jgi:hypothetical protein
MVPNVRKTRDNNDECSVECEGIKRVIDGDGAMERM